MSLSSTRTSSLLGHPDFTRPSSSRLSFQDDINLTYRRARAIGLCYKLTSSDILHLTPKFWDLHMDPILVQDQGATTLLTIQYNLAAGTLAPFAARRPELMPLMQRILDFDINAQFLLTEVAHGLDAPNLETTATLLPNGQFDLHTPNDGACKYMPPTGPFGGIEKVGIVFARLIVNSEDRGVRPFIVGLSDGVQCCRGVSMKLLPQRGGIRPVDHALTRFTHVLLPPSALLGPLTNPPNFNPRTHFLASIWRVSVGALALSTITVPFLTVAAYTLARYSMRRRVGSPPAPIWAFRTQHGPVLHALAQGFVLQAQARDAIALYMDKSLSAEVRAGVAAAAKASMMGMCVSTLQILGERSGSHGMFEHNKFLACELGIRGSRIAEGDVLVLCIRLTTELLLGRYTLPKPRNPSSPLALHEHGLFTSLHSLIHGAHHRAPHVNALLLPQCTTYVCAIGHRMAYESALKHGVPQALVDLYEINAIMSDAAWYSENLQGMGRWEQIVKEESALSTALPFTERYLEMTGAEEYVVSPIVTQRGWDEFVEGLPVFEGDARVALIPEVRSSKLQKHQPQLDGGGQVMARL